MEQRYELFGLAASAVGLTGGEITAAVSAVCAVICTGMSLVKLIVRVVAAWKAWRSGKITTEQCVDAMTEATEEFKEDTSDEV